MMTRISFASSKQVFFKSNLIILFHLLNAGDFTFDHSVGAGPH
jgi:hypothetical protein